MGGREGERAGTVSHTSEQIADADFLARGVAADREAGPAEARGAEADAGVAREAEAFAGNSGEGIELRIAVLVMDDAERIGARRQPFEADRGGVGGDRSGDRACPFAIGEIGEIGRLITNSSQGMSSLLKDLLDYIKANVYSKSLKFDEVNVHGLITSKLYIFESVNELKHNQVFNLVPESLIVRSDYQMLAIIIHNLIDNATKFTNHGIFSVSSGKIEDKVYLIFSNNGIPISEELLNMFNEEPGFTDTASTIGRKTGLGFLIVKEIASLIGVQLTVSQTETTNFHLTFESPL